MNKPRAHYFDTPLRVTCVDPGISFLILQFCILLSFFIPTIMCVQKTAEYRSLVVFQNRGSSCHCWPELLFQMKIQLDKIPLETTIYQCCKLAYGNREPCRYCSVEARSAYSLQARGRAKKKKTYLELFASTRTQRELSLFAVPGLSFALAYAHTSYRIFPNWP